MPSKHVLARLFPGRRPPPRPLPLMHARAHQAPVVVKGIDHGSTYTDDYGNEWTYEEGVLLNRAVTTAYGGQATEWRYTRSQTNNNIDARAELMHDVSKAGSDAMKAAAEAGTSTPEKKSPTGGGSATTVKKAITKMATPAPGKSISAWTAIATVGPPIAGYFIAALPGLGVGAALGLGAYLISRKATS